MPEVNPSDYMNISPYNGAAFGAIVVILIYNYTFEELGANPLDTLHTLTIAHLQADNPDAVLNIVDPIKPEPLTINPIINPIIDESETN